MVTFVPLALTALLRCLATKRLIGHTPTDWPLLFLFLLLRVWLWASADRSVTLVQTYALLANLALFWAVAALTQTRWLRWTGWALLAAGFVLAVVFLFGTQFVAAKLPFIHRDIYGLLPGGLRPFWNPEGLNANLTGGLLGLFLMPAVILTLAGEGWLQRGLGLVVSSLLAVMVLLAQSGGALIGVAVALPVVTILLNRRLGLVLVDRTDRWRSIRLHAGDAPFSAINDWCQRNSRVEHPDRPSGDLESGTVSGSGLFVHRRGHGHVRANG